MHSCCMTLMHVAAILRDQLVDESDAADAMLSETNSLTTHGLRDSPIDRWTARDEGDRKRE